MSPSFLPLLTHTTDAEDEAHIKQRESHTDNSDSSWSLNKITHFISLCSFSLFKKFSGPGAVSYAFNPSY
jgi:hypothetical protein